MSKEVYIVFDGFPGPQGPRFVEVETKDGASIRAGEWVRNPGNGLCYLGPFYIEEDNGNED